MNTANLQLEGLLLAISSLLDAIERKGLLTRQDIEHALDEAEARAALDLRRPAEVSPANVDAIAFPIRFLRIALTEGEGSPRLFSEIAARVGQTKPER